MRRIVWVVLGCAGVLALPSCSDDGDEGQPRTEAGVVQAAEDQWQAIVEGDAAAAYAYLAATCQEQVDEDTYAEQLELVLASLRATIGLDDLSAVDLVVEVRRFSDDSADVYSNLERDGSPLFPEEDVAQVETWEWDGEGWRTTACPPARE